MVEQMKPSGIDWIKEIPVSWNINKVKYLATDSNTLFLDGDWIESDVIEDSGIRYLTTGNVGAGYYKDQGSGYISQKTFNELHCLKVFPGDLMISRLNEPIGRACIVPDGENFYVVAVDNVILRPNAEYNKKFIMYAMNTDGYAEHGNIIARGATMSRVSRSQLGQFWIAYPELREQNAIADYLDTQCLKLDGIISDLEKQIETLQKYKKSLILETVTKGLNKNVPMKPSGIDWIGDIPAHWDINKIKYLFSIVNGSTPESNDLNCWDGDICWITPADMEDFGEIAFGERNITTFGYDSCGTSLLPIGSIVISTRAPIGKINITTNVLCTNQGCKSLVGNKDNKYFYYLLYALKDQLTLLGRGTTFLELSTSALANFKIINPKDEEQICIVNYLDSQCGKIDSILKDKQEQLEKIKQHKKSLIYEYITGKKRVKEATNGN